MSNENGGLTALDYWRLADDLALPDAAILITGNNPEETVPLFHDHHDDDPEYVQRRDYQGYEAVLKALKRAILREDIQCSISYAMRGKREFPEILYEGSVEVVNVPGERPVGYDMFVTIRDKAIQSFGLENLPQQTYYIRTEPNWDETTVDVSSLKEWLEAKGIRPSFFFPEQSEEGFRDKHHPRYSAKLAACVAAWEACEQKAESRTVKQTLKEWLQSNATQYGVGENGIVSDTAALELAKVVNWDTKGGAPTTGPDD
jgi:hypothetical protein